MTSQCSSSAVAKQQTPLALLVPYWGGAGCFFKSIPSLKSHPNVINSSVHLFVGWCKSSMTMIKHHEGKQAGRKGLISLSLPGHSPAPREVRVVGQRLMKRQWRSAAYWTALHGFLSLISYTRMAPKGWACPPQSLIKKIHYRSFWRKEMHSLRSVFLFSSYSIFCQVGIKPHVWKCGKPHLNPNFVL